VMEALWPELDPIAADNNLRKALHRARRALTDDPGEGARLIASLGGALSLASDAWIDVEAFVSMAEDARRSRDPLDYERAIALYRGDLLPEDRYEPWVMARSDELRNEVAALLLEQAGLWEARGEIDLASAAVRRSLAQDRTEEKAAASLMRLSALAGRRHEALETFDRLRDALRSELGVDPSPQTHELREEIAAGGGLGPTMTAGLWERVGDLRLRSGDVIGAAQAFGSAIDADDTTDREALARRHRKAAGAYLGAHDVTAADPHLAAASRLATGDDRERVRIAVLEATACCERGDLATAAELAVRAIELAEAQGDASDVAAAHEATAIVHHMRGTWREGLREEIERLTRAPDDDELTRVFDIHHCIGQYHLYGDGLWEDVEPYARATLEHAEQAGAVRAQAFAWCLLGESLLLQARFDEAAGCLERSGEMHASLGTRSGALPWQRLGEVMVCRGDPDAAAPYLRRASGIATVSPMAPHLWGRIHATTAFAALERRDAGAATRSVHAAAEAAARYGDCPTCSALLHPVAAEAFAKLGAPDRARIHMEAARGVADRSESSAWRAMAVAAEGSLHTAEGDHGTARECYSRAAALYARAGQPYWASRAETEAARER